MKKVYFIFILGILTQPALACEFCGCSSGNYFIGPFPQFKSHFIGTRYSFRRFNTSVTGDPSQFSNDFYQTIELWGGVNLGSRWQILGFLPYNINHQHSDDGKVNVQGLGDATILINYNLFKTQTPGRSGQQLWIGGGLKVPTGKFSIDPDDLVASANSQPGSGSFDYLLNTMYTAHVNSWGLNSNANYKINQKADDFRFGNRFAASAFVFHSFSTLPAVLSPNVGLLYENLAASRQNGIKVEATGGNALLAAAGLETSVKRLMFGFNLQLPLSQNFSNGQTDTKIRGMMHVTYAF